MGRSTPHAVCNASGKFNLIKLKLRLTQSYQPIIFQELNQLRKFYDIPKESSFAVFQCRQTIGIRGEKKKKEKKKKDRMLYIHEHLSKTHIFVDHFT